MTARDLLETLRYLVEVERRGDDDVRIETSEALFVPLGVDHKGGGVRILAKKRGLGE